MKSQFEIPEDEFSIDITLGGRVLFTTTLYDLDLILQNYKPENPSNYDYLDLLKHIQESIHKLYNCKLSFKQVERVYAQKMELETETKKNGSQSSDPSVSGTSPTTFSNITDPTTVS